MCEPTSSEWCRDGRPNYAIDPRSIMPLVTCYSGPHSPCKGYQEGPVTSEVCVRLWPGCAFVCAVAALWRVFLLLPPWRCHCLAAAAGRDVVLLSLSSGGCRFLVLLGGLLLLQEVWWFCFGAGKCFVLGLLLVPAAAARSFPGLRWLLLQLLHCSTAEEEQQQQRKHPSQRFIQYELYT